MDSNNIIEACNVNYNFDILDNKCQGKYNKIVKRLIGLILSIILFIILLPFMFLIACAIVIDSGFPVFYKANRGGYKEKPFNIYKFRTMVKGADKIGGGTTALNDSRITKVGQILRKIKADEIPQLINIIKGEMSFVGPRPELLNYTSQYNELEKYILNVRPGITDFSSIEFINLDEIVGSDNADDAYERYVLPTKNRLRLKYVSELSFGTDCKIFLTTIMMTVKKAIVVIQGGNNGKSFDQKY